MSFSPFFIIFSIFASAATAEVAAREPSAAAKAPTTRTDMVRLDIPVPPITVGRGDRQDRRTASRRGSPDVYFVAESGKVTSGENPNASATRSPPVQGARRTRTSVCRIMDKPTEQDRRFAELMGLSQEGDTVAYVTLLREVRPLLERSIRQKRPFLQSHDVEDLVQNVLLALHSVRATYDPTRPFLPWLMAIMRHRIADAARRHVRRGANETIVEQVPETFSDDGTNIYGDAHGDPEALRAAVNTLPPGQRRAIE